MSSMPQVSASVVSAVNQNSVGLANFNIDLSLVKITPLQEYIGLGTSLSLRRRKNAEEGPLHRTARRLGLLFEQVVPPIPDLIKAYGIRASEIAGVKDTAPEVETLFGAFSGHVGVDGTSIYAAATSGSSAIALHLLACMLARAWSAPVATSIWVELVTERKAELEKNADCSQLQGLLARATAQQEIARSDLAAWDASARAWLRTADEVKVLQQTQLKLVIKDSRLSLNTSGSTYNSVLEAWLMAMKSLQQLVLGSPHNISKGSVLLGLLSWHIYPDLNIVDPTADIQFHDPVVQVGGVVTLGLQRTDALGNGVHWSLSLSHLRFYGSAVVERSIGSVDSDDGRITLPELHLVALGCFVSSWRDAVNVDLVAVSNCLIALGRCLAQLENMHPISDERDLTRSLDWLELLVGAAKSFLSSQGLQRKQALDLVEFGRRRARHFLDNSPKKFCPMFGLVNPLVLFQFLDDPKDDGERNTSVSALRNLARQCQLDDDDCIIAYRPKTSPFMDLETLDSAETHRVYEVEGEYTTVIPPARKSRKRSWSGASVNCRAFCTCENCEGPKLSHANLQIPTNDLWWLKEGDSNHRDMKFIWRSPPLRFSKRYHEIRRNRPDRGGRFQNFYDLEKYLQGDGDTLPEVSPKSKINYRLLARYPENAALFTLNPDVTIFPTLSFDELTATLKSSSICRQRLLDYIMDLPRNGIYDNGTHRFRSSPKSFFTSLRALVLASELYQGWPKATVSIEITKKPLGHSHWATSLFSEPEKTQDRSACEHPSNQPLSFPLPSESLRFNDILTELSTSGTDATPTVVERQSSNSGFYRACKFACIAMFESGLQDLHPDQLKTVMAMASGNSIFTVESLVQDPSVQDKSDLSRFTGIRRILGTIDRPGIVMLVPPQAPRIREPDLKNWRNVHQAEFEGVLKDSFKQTSLHLAFTEYEIPLAIAPGAVDAEVIILEALISVHDGRDWVGDLDVLGSLASIHLKHPKCECVQDPEPETFSRSLAKALGSRLRSITNWEEFLCCKENLIDTEIGVIRASNNWIARLAAVSLSVGKGYSSILIPSSSICSGCSERWVSEKKWISESGKNFDLLVT